MMTTKQSDRLGLSLAAIGVAMIDVTYSGILYGVTIRSVSFLILLPLVMWGIYSVLLYIRNRQRG
jgi:hypothetical protein